MENVEKFKEIGDSGYIYQNELDKACFQRSLSYGDCKDLSRRAASEKKNKKMRDKAFTLHEKPHFLFPNVLGR